MLINIDQTNKTLSTLTMLYSQTSERLDTIYIREAQDTQKLFWEQEKVHMEAKMEGQRLPQANVGNKLEKRRKNATNSRGYCTSWCYQRPLWSLYFHIFRCQVF